MQQFRRLATAALASTLALVVVGGLVRASGSGLGCLDEWPQCKGGWFAPTDLKGIIEYSHRGLALIVIALIIGLAFAARRPDVPRHLRRWAYVAVVPFVLQALLGALVVFRDLHAAIVTLHFAAAMFLVFATVRMRVGAEVIGRERNPAPPKAIGAVAGVALVLLAGTIVRERGAGLAFDTWPLMPGPYEAAQWMHLAHRVLAALVFVHLVVTAIRSKHPLARLTVVLYAIQGAIGAANVLTSLAPTAVLAHVAVGALTWAAVCAFAISSRYELQPGRVGAYVQLTKPRIIVLLLVTTLPTMVIAAKAIPSVWLMAATLIGGTLAAGGANAINQFLDRDIDEKMKRTSKRPLPAHKVAPHKALAFGVALGVIAFAWLWATVNLLSAILAVAALLFYVLVYTMMLKRTTAQNIVIGGAAGAVPVLVGWAAVTGELGLVPWILFAIVFAWTPPHFWALSMRYADDYAAAGVPMMPVVKGVAETTRQIVLYTILTVLITLALVPAARMGWLYAVTALGLGAWFVYRALWLKGHPTPEAGMRVFKYSINYLGVLFAVMAVDRLVLR